MSEALEHHEHAEHAATHGSKRTALLIAVLAALLAITEQQGRHAEIRVSINSILAADAWSQYPDRQLPRIFHKLSPRLSPAAIRRQRRGA
jgi:hypothetical protein